MVAMIKIAKNIKERICNFKIVRRDKMKLFAVVLALVAIAVTPLSVFASENNSDEQIFIIREDEIIENLQKMSDEELLELGYSDEQITELRNFDYFDALAERAALDDETLLLYRYTPEEIEELREYVASGRKARKTISSNTLTISLSFKNKTTGKQADGVISWTWKRAALVKYIDCVAVAWKTTSGATINYIPNSNNKVVATWTKVNPNSTEPNQKTSSSTWQVNNNQSIFARVAMGGTNYFAYSGTGTFTMKATSGSFKEFYIDYGYGHYNVSLEPSVSVSPSGIGVSVSFKGGLNDEQHIKRLYNASFGIAIQY